MDASKEICKNSMNSTNRIPKKAGQGEKLKARKEMLEKVYLDIADSELHEVVDEIVSSDKKHNYKANWKLVNEAGMIILATYCGVEFSADSKDDNVTQIFQNVPIDDSLFPMDEFKAVKKNIKTSKEARPEGISPEVLKYCDLDETIPQFAIKLLIYLDKPDQWSESSHTEKR